MIGYYRNDLKNALPFQHRKYFQQHINGFDWYWYTEEDLLYFNHTYWNLIEDTSFAFNTLSSTQTDQLLKLYAHKTKKPKLSPFNRYFFLPTLIRFEIPENDNNYSIVQSANILDLWELTDMSLNSETLIEALIFFKEQWWFQPTNSHSAYYLLPRAHMHRIVTNRNWLNEVNIYHRELISSFWLLNFGYIRVTSLTKFDQYLVHHASNKYSNQKNTNLPKVSSIARGLGFEYERDSFSPSSSLVKTFALEYTMNHEYDIASCFPMKFSLVPNKLHKGIPKCEKLVRLNKIN